MLWQRTITGSPGLPGTSSGNNNIRGHRVYVVVANKSGVTRCVHLVVAITSRDHQVQGSPGTSSGSNHQQRSPLTRFMLWQLTVTGSPGTSSGSNHQQRSPRFMLWQLTIKWLPGASCHINHLQRSPGPRVSPGTYIQCTLILLQKKLRYKYLKNEQIFLICKY